MRLDLPDQGTDASHGSSHSLANISDEDARGSLGDAGRAVEDAAIVVAPVYSGVDGVSRSVSGNGGKGGEPHHNQESIEDEHGDDVVSLLEGTDLLGQDDVECDDPGDDAL